MSRSVEAVKIKPQKVLVVLSRFPYPLDKGDKLRAYHQIKQLSETNEVYLFCLSHHEVPEIHRAHLSTYCRRIEVYQMAWFSSLFYLILNFFSFKPLQCAFFYSYKAKRFFTKFLNQIQPDHVFTQLLRMVAYTRSLKYPKSLDLQDAFSQSTYRRYQRASWYLKLPLWYEYKALKHAEKQAQFDYSLVFIISEKDKSFINFQNQNQLKVLPNGIDISYFSDNAPCKEKEYDFVFSGNMSYPPNEDAALFLIKEILPIVQEQIPEVKILIAGTSPALYLRSKQSKNIIISGWLPDIRDAYKSSRIFVAPLRMGGGLQNKVLEALAMGLPCICPPLVIDGLQGENLPALPILKSDIAPKEFAQKMIDLYQNSQMQEKMGKEGANYVRTYFDWNLPAYNLHNYIAEGVHESLSSNY